ncbi:hydantoinase B/oxoprolinase family protein [Desulfonema magnum]|uniref:Hydantoinase family protein n=1 Tax=Desulfonema magnum TaxID=45655 RepID=A0A975GNA9_9BACT|nr:hydantoinase B/oxoprolinase family protein [Desulfonema magnum]QTA87585.1 Hydantoinase family protein [Desulfonema magnum]
MISCSFSAAVAAPIRAGHFHDRDGFKALSVAEPDRIISDNGHHCAIFPANGANTPAKILESNTPFLAEARKIVCDSGCPGKMRGGLDRPMVI